MWIKKIMFDTINKIEQKNKLELITELLIIGNTTEECLSLFSKIESNLLFEMNKRKIDNESENKIILDLLNKKNYLLGIEVDYQQIKSKENE